MRDVTDTLVRTLGFSAAAIVVLGTGVWLTRLGWPYDAAILNIHKLVALAVVVVLGILVYRAACAAPLAPGDWAMVVSAGLLCVISFASGGVASAMESTPGWVLWVHRISSWVAAGTVAMCLVKVV